MQSKSAGTLKFRGQAALINPEKGKEARFGGDALQFQP